MREAPRPVHASNAMSPLLKLCRCGNLTQTGRCASCKPTLSERAKPRRENYQSVYATPRWRALRARIVTPGSECELRLPGCLITATVCGHVEPFDGASDPLAWDPANLRPECSACSGKEAATRQAHGGRR